jgi:hypothetical protein
MIKAIGFTRFIAAFCGCVITLWTNVSVTSAKLCVYFYWKKKDMYLWYFFVLSGFQYGCGLFKLEKSTFLSYIKVDLPNLSIYILSIGHSINLFERKLTFRYIMECSYDSNLDSRQGNVLKFPWLNFPLKCFFYLLFPFVLMLY